MNKDDEIKNVMQNCFNNINNHLNDGGDQIDIVEKIDISESNKIQIDELLKDVDYKAKTVLELLVCTNINIFGELISDNIIIKETINILKSNIVEMFE